MILYRSLVSGLLYPEMKTRRAEVHLNELELEVRKFIDTNLDSHGPFIISRKDNVKKHWHVISIEVKPTPESIQLLLGEFAFSLRSALDQLAWQLALKHLDRPKSATSFPIRGIPPSPPKGFGASIRDILPAAVPLIKELQPYNRGAAFKDHPLWILNELCIIDKHATPAVNSTAFPLSLHGAETLRKREFPYRTEITVSLSDKFKAQLQPGPPEIIFGKPMDSAGPGFEVRIGELRPIYEFVRDSVIPRFACFFK